MTLRTLTCSNMSFIVEATKYLLRISLKSVPNEGATADQVTAYQTTKNLYHEADSRHNDYYVY